MAQRFRRTVNTGKLVYRIKIVCGISSEVYLGVSETVDVAIRNAGMLAEKTFAGRNWQIGCVELIGECDW